MSAVLAKHNIAYISAPKCACTSIKELIFCLENNCKFNKVRDHKGALCLIINEKKHYIHDFYPTISFAKQEQTRLQRLHCFCIVRDPIDRIISCYNNRVLRYKVLTQDALSEADIRAPANPDPNQFIKNLDQYKKISDIKHHTLPLIHFLGSESNFYDEIFNLNSLNKAEKTLKRHFGKQNANLLHLQRTNRDIQNSLKNTLEKETIKNIEEIYEQDYNAYGDFF